MQKNEVSENQLQVSEGLAAKINAARVAVNVMTILGVFIALFTGVMLGIFNSTVPNASASDFLLGFLAFFFGIGIPCVIAQQLVRRAIAQTGLWHQSLVWCYCILLLPLFPIGTAASGVILFAQISWMRSVK
ncbi:MAG: cadmium resistance protein CadD (predicted permease) [Oleispira sp.]|jgi:cadmium resistance protein CadD (predicted permease)